jgi:hypothetical protein
MVLICIALLFSVTSAAPDPHRFDPLLKTSWYGLYMQGAKIGYVEQTLDKISDPIDGWRMQSRMSINLRMAGQQVSTIADDTRLFKSPGGELHSNTFTMTSPTGVIRVDGRIENGKYVVDSDIGGEKTQKAFRYPLDYLDSVMVAEMGIAGGKAAVGDSFSADYFEPTPPLTGMIHQQTRILKKEQHLINGVPTDVYDISISIPAVNVTTESKIDAYGNTLEGSMGGTMTMKLEGEAQARQLDDTYDILANNLIVTGTLIDEPWSLRRLTLRISGIDTTEILQTSTQHVVTDTSGFLRVEIRRDTAPDRTIVLPMTEESLQPFLKPDPLEQSDNPEIIKMSKEIVGDEKEAWKAAQKINEWVYRNIDKRFSPDLSNALQTLHSRRGDCGEHTALAVALMRAAGIPARPVVGLLYAPEGRGFAYHAWVEAYVGKWVMMDPTWNERLANPTHIALARGDLIQQVSALHRVMGKMKIEVVGEG